MLVVQNFEASRFGFLEKATFTGFIAIRTFPVQYTSGYDKDMSYGAHPTEYGILLHFVCNSDMHRSHFCCVNAVRSVKVPVVSLR